MSSLIVIDNFYPSPKSILKKLSKMNFVEPEDADGWRTSEGYFPKLNRQGHCSVQRQIE